MDNLPASSVSTATLLYRTDNTASHSIRKQGDATQTAFSEYAFGPIQNGSTKSNTGVKPLSGFLAKTATTTAGNVDQSWITTVQGSAVSANKSS